MCQRARKVTIDARLGQYARAYRAPVRSVRLGIVHLVAVVVVVVGGVGVHCRTWIDAANSFLGERRREAFDERRL